MATPTAITSSPTMGGEASPIRNGSATNLQTYLQSGQISGDLRNLVALLGSQSGSGITLEQLLSATSSTNRVATPTSSAPSTPQTGEQWSTGKKRGRGTTDTPLHLKRRRVSSAKQSTDKQQGKGLRHFSQRVCEKVREKGTTSYNEVADELVKELSESESGASDIPVDQKNIRRRVYDALNVLMAMNIISKEKKEIKWIGLPTNSAQECQHIEDELSKVEQRVQSKRDEVEGLLIQILSFKNLMKRNRERVSSLGAPAQNPSIALPFILVNTSKKTTIDCSISSDKSEYVFSFDNAFELHNDIEVLKKMGLDCGLTSGACTEEDVKTAKAMLPKAFAATLDEIVSAKTTAPTSSATPTLTPDTLHTASPLTSHSTPLSESPLVKDQLVAALSQMRSNSNSPFSSPIVVPSNPASGIPSPQAVTALMTSVMRGGKGPQKTGSPGLAAKAVLHSQCPSSQPPVSPLVKVSAIQAQSNPTPSPGRGSPSTPQQKLVTVSKLTPASPENISSLLLQLQQNSTLSKLISTAASTVSASRQLFSDGGGAKTSKASSVEAPKADKPQ